MLEIKSFASLDEGTFQGGVKFSKILRWVAHKEEGAGEAGGRGGRGQVGSGKFRIFWVGLGKKGCGQYFRVGSISWRTLCHVRDPCC